VPLKPLAIIKNLKLKKFDKKIHLISSKDGRYEISEG
jgi:hypothetical protein